MKVREGEPRKVPASNLLQTIAANVDNEKLTDAEFRDFVRRCVVLAAP